MTFLASNPPAARLAPAPAARRLAAFAALRPHRFACGRLAALAVVASILLASSVPAQQTLDDAAWFERQIAEGVVWRFYLFDDLYGGKQSIACIEADLDHPEVIVEFPYLQFSRGRTSAMIPGQFPAAVGGVNGTYFDTAAGGGGCTTYLRVGGVDVTRYPATPGYMSREGAVGIAADGGVAVLREPPERWGGVAGYPDLMANGPLLIENRIIPLQHFANIGSHCTGRHPRSAVGLTADNRLLLVTVDGRTEQAMGMTCEQLALVMEHFGCVDALNLDGGGSTTLWVAGEPFNGVVNYPSDNGAYDHLGERSCSNAIAIVAPPPTTAPDWDARLESKTFRTFMTPETTQTVTLAYRNLGTETWTTTNTLLATARPAGRTTPLATGAGWHSPTNPAAMTPDTVAPGELATFTFQLMAPGVTTSQVFDEHFQLLRVEEGERFGPADSEAWMRVIAALPAPAGATFLVEPRAGGQNYPWYDDSGMADTTGNCLAPGTTGNIGMRWGSTYRSVAGAKRATAAPVFPEAGRYNVYVAWGQGANRRNPVTYKVTHADGIDKFLLDQTLTPNLWYRLGDAPFFFEVGPGGKVDMTNEDINVSGSMYFGAVMFEFVAPPVEDDFWLVF